MSDFQFDLDQTAKQWIVTFHGVSPMIGSPYWVCELMDCEPCIAGGIGQANVNSHFAGHGVTLELSYREACRNQKRGFTHDELVLEKLGIKINASPTLDQPFSMLIDGIHMIEGRGCIATGKIQGKISIGDEVEISGLVTVVTGIETFRRFVEYADDGCFVGLVLRGIKSEQISVGQIIKKIKL